jgi:hypothetical protein
MKAFLTLALSIIVAACGTTPTSTDPATMLFSVKQGYNVAQKAALLYEANPLCGSPAAAGSKTGCSDPATVIKIDNMNQAAVSAIKAADDAVKAGAANAVVLINAASAATSTLSAQTPKVQP